MSGENGSNGNGQASWDGKRTVTLPYSGRVVTLNYVSPLLLNDLRKATAKTLRKRGVEKPVVPAVNGTDNPHHPEYLVAQHEYAMAEGEVFLELLFKYGVADAVDVEAVAALRKLGEEDGLDLPADDKVLYVTRLLAGNNDDIVTLQDAIMGTGHPTEKAVAEKLAAFPAEVQEG